MARPRSKKAESLPAGGPPQRFREAWGELRPALELYLRDPIGSDAVRAVLSLACEKAIADAVEDGTPEAWDRAASRASQIQVHLERAASLEAARNVSPRELAQFFDKFFRAVREKLGPELAAQVMAAWQTVSSEGRTREVHEHLTELEP